MGEEEGEARSDGGGDTGNRDYLSLVRQDKVYRILHEALLRKLVISW